MIPYIHIDVIEIGQLPLQPFGILVAQRGRASGWYVVATCILYAPVRFALDFLRIENATGGDPRYGGLTPAQWACGGLLLFGLGLAWRLYMRPEQLKAEARPAMRKE